MLITPTKDDRLSHVYHYQYQSKPISSQIKLWSVEGREVQLPNKHLLSTVNASVKYSVPEFDVVTKQYDNQTVYYLRWRSLIVIMASNVFMCDVFVFTLTVQSHNKNDLFDGALCIVLLNCCNTANVTFLKN